MFPYDGVRPTAQGTLSGDTFTATQRFVWEGNSYYSPLVYEVYADARYYPLYDGLGSTRQLIDENEAVTDTYQYEAFGNLMASTGSTPNPYRYVGSLGYYQIYPPASGGRALMHLGRRYYMPETGRFIQWDPVSKASIAQPALKLPAAGANGQNRFGDPYIYGANGPIGLVDPAGLAPSRPDCDSCKERGKCRKRCWEDYRDEQRHINNITSACLIFCLIAEPTVLCEAACVTYMILEMDKADRDRKKCLKRCDEDYPCENRK